MAVSRILFSHRRGDVKRRSFILLRHLGAGAVFLDCDYYPEVCSLFFRETGQATPSSCFVLHRMGFVMPPCFRSGRWALTPPFHPCFVPHGSCVLRRSPWRMKRFVFCDTFRYKELSFSAPPLSRGVPPYGVRTFLFGVPRGAEATVRHQTKA